MERYELRYPAKERVPHRAHVGVVGSGDLEVLLEPSDGDEARVTIRTSVDGYEAVWRRVLDRFFERWAGAASIEINDFGATPGMVTLRLEQAAEESRS